MNLHKLSKGAIIAVAVAAMLLMIITAGLLSANQSIASSGTKATPASSPSSDPPTTQTNETNTQTNATITQANGTIATPTPSPSSDPLIAQVLNATITQANGTITQGPYDFLIAVNATNGQYYAQASNGTVCFTSPDASYVINQCINSLSVSGSAYGSSSNSGWGGSLVFANGIYNCYSTILIPPAGGFTLEGSTPPWDNGQDINEFANSVVLVYYGNDWMLKVNTEGASYPAPLLNLNNLIFEVASDSQSINGGLDLNYANGQISNIFVIGAKANYNGTSNPVYGDLLGMYTPSGTIGVLDAIKNRDQISFNEVTASNFETGWLTCADWLTLNQCTATNAVYGFVFYGADLVTSIGCHDYGCTYGYVGNWMTGSLVFINPACEGGGSTAVGFFNFAVNSPAGENVVIINPIFASWTGTKYMWFSAQVLTNATITS